MMPPSQRQDIFFWRWVLACLAMVVFSGLICFLLLSMLFGTSDDPAYGGGGGLFALALLCCVGPASLISYRLGTQSVAFLSARMGEIESDMPALLADGTIRLIRVSWLLAQSPGWVIMRRQDLPEAAFVPIQEAVKMLRERRVGVLSYRWLSAAHPDPEGLHLSAMRTFLNQPRDGSAARVAALFWDFMSCHQKERTEEEAQSFRRALKVMTCLYASPNTLVLQHKRLPGPADTSYTPLAVTFPEDPQGIADYDHSGWCRRTATDEPGTLILTLTARHRRVRPLGLVQHEAGCRVASTLTPTPTPNPGAAWSRLPRRSRRYEAARSTCSAWAR